MTDMESYEKDLEKRERAEHQYTFMLYTLFIEVIWYTLWIIIYGSVMWGLLPNETKEDCLASYEKDYPFTSSTNQSTTKPQNVTESFYSMLVMLFVTNILVLCIAIPVKFFFLSAVDKKLSMDMDRIKQKDLRPSQYMTAIIFGVFFIQTISVGDMINGHLAKVCTGRGDFNLNSFNVEDCRY